MRVSNSTGHICREQITLGSVYKVGILSDTAVSYRGTALHTWHTEPVSRVPEPIVQAGPNATNMKADFPTGRRPRC